MKTFLSFDELSSAHVEQYKNLVGEAFPEIVSKSEVVSTCWKKVERYFPEYQRFLIDNRNFVAAFVCTLPFYWNQRLDELPDDGWDWLMRKGIEDFENSITPNFLGGLQIVISRTNRGKGLSKRLISEGKRIKQDKGLTYFVLPIRPTFKHKFPQMPMREYIQYKEDERVFDPWIRSHLKSGARMIRVCTNSMNVRGNIEFWEDLKNEKITTSGMHEVEGALNPVFIDIESNSGEYREENIWIYYD